jgi:ubiquinone/menaquinone biosynthesis C-methylase UbiE
MIGCKKSRIAELQQQRGISRRDFFEYQYEGAKGALEQMCKFVDINDKEILDLGCGYGGFSAYLAINGLKVVAVDYQQYDKEFLKDAIEFSNQKNTNANFCQADAHYLPFKDSIFDIIRLDSVLEHLTNPKVALSECQRILKPEGYIFISFPLFYSPYGGHVDDYLRFPWIHVLPKNWVCWLLSLCKSKIGLVTTEYTKNLYLSLNKLTLKKYKRMIKKLEFNEIFFEEAFYMPHDASLFVNKLKDSFYHKSLKSFFHSFSDFNWKSFLVFVFLYILYRLPSPVRKRWNEFITSGIRSVLSV